MITGTATTTTTTTTTTYNNNNTTTTTTTTPTTTTTTIANTTTRIHIKLLDYFAMSRISEVKAAYLLTLVQLSKDSRVVEECMKDDLIGKLANEITQTKDVTMWDSISQLLLAVVSLNDKPDMQYIPNIIKILRLICVSKTPLKVLR